MYVDGQLLFSDAQDIKTSPAASTNIIDLSVTNRYFGEGKPLYIVVCVTTVFTGSGAAIIPTLVMDDNTSIGSGTTVQTLPTIAALAAVGTKVTAQINWNIITERYIAMVFTESGGTITQGNVDAFITDTPQMDRQHADNLTITEGAT